MPMQTDLGAWLGDLFANIANTTTYPWVVYIYSGVMNLFVPSGGGQWAVQGPIQPIPPASMPL